MDTVNERFKETRKNLKLSQKDFAAALGISQTHVSGIENGKENPSITILKLISIKYNIDEDWLTTGEGHFMTNWSLQTDDGVIAMYKDMDIIFRDFLKDRTGNNLAYTIQAFTYLVSILSLPKLFGDDMSIYLKSVMEAVDNFEKLMFKVSSSLPPSKKDAVYSMSYKNECNKYLENITDNIKTAANVYLCKFWEEMKL